MRLISIPQICERNESVKETMQEIRKIGKDKETYMQDMPETAYRDSTSTDSVQSVIKISKCCRTLVK